MGQTLILFVFYAICASAVLVWSTLLDEGRALRPQAFRAGIEYVEIPQQSLLELAEKFPNLVIFDLHGDHVASGWAEVISCWLPISRVDLPSILKWLPSASKVVFCCREATGELDTQTKTILLQFGIRSVYFLDDSLVHQADRCCGLGVSTHSANLQLRRLTTTEARRRLMM